MKEKVYIILSVLFSTVAMCIVDGILTPPYFYKSLIKILLFLLVPLLFFLFFKGNDSYLKALFIPRKRELLPAIALGLGVFSIILAAFFLLGQYIDLSGIKESLTSGIGVSADNFIYVAIYISFINSLLEEFFFRGYAFLLLKQLHSRRFAYLFSAGMFALYHVGMTNGWFNILIYLLSMIGLFLGGCIFNFLNEKCKNIYPSWLVHMCANFAINTIGCILFDIL